MSSGSIYAQRSVSYQKHSRGQSHRRGESSDNLLPAHGSVSSISQFFPGPSPLGGPSPLIDLRTLNVEQETTRPVSPDSRSPTRASRHRTTMSIARRYVGTNYGPYSYEQFDSKPPVSDESHSSTTSTTHVVNQRSWRSEKADLESTPRGYASTTTTGLPEPIYDEFPEPDDALHRPDAIDQPFILCSARGWVNALMLLIVAAGVLTLFPGIFIYSTITMSLNKSTSPGFGLGGINATGQIPDLPNLPSLIDKETPQDARSRTGTDGTGYKLVFSDEFNTDGRTFWPGDDPYWEAQDLNYWPTGDLEWYSPEALVTQNGKLVITLSDKDTHNLQYQSGMMTTWNKFCYTTGYVEVSVSLPGNNEFPGFWPAAWSMGNLGKAGYGATTDGTWPYSYDSCDLGTFKSQQDKDGNPTSSDALSGLPGQRLSACTCPGSEHPGPSVSTGRGVPEIDILEAQIDQTNAQGSVSQSFQLAPFDANLQYNNTAPATTINNSTITQLNGFKGTTLQQSLSAVSDIDTNVYNNTAYATYGYEWYSDPNNRQNGYITWFSEGQPTWTLTADAIGPDSGSEVSQRLIPEEPMYLILNLGLSPSFQPIDFQDLEFPAMMYVDYVRVYQRDDVNEDGLTCDPKNHPTADYINSHPNAYTNVNMTTWEMAGYDTPKNSQYDGC